MGYFILDHGRSSSAAVLESFASKDLDALAEVLSGGVALQRQAALRELVERRAEETLVRCLASANETVSRLAMHGLWECWLGERGLPARQRLEDGIHAMNDGNMVAASEMFQVLMAEYPDWAEPANKQATVLYLQGLPEKSIAICHEVLALKPDHFGAWNGLAVCAIQSEQWALALEAVRQSLRLQPHSASNQQLLKLVETRLAPH